MTIYIYTVSPPKVTAITIDFWYLPSVTTKQGSKQNEGDYY